MTIAQQCFYFFNYCYSCGLTTTWKRWGNASQALFNALEGDNIKIIGVKKASSPEVSLGQFHYNQSTGILSFENQQFAELQAGADLRVDRDVILSINS